MKKMSKMKKGLVGLTAAAMLVGSCVAGPAFADDVTDAISKINEGKSLTVTVDISDAWTVTVPTNIAATFDSANNKITLSKGKLNAKFDAAPRFENGKKLVVYLHDKTGNEGVPISSLKFKEQDSEGNADKINGHEYVMELRKGNESESTELNDLPLLTDDGKILEIVPGEKTNLGKDLVGEVADVCKTGKYKATAAFVVKLEDNTI